jgi:Cu/Ag efflux protein CusF
MKTPFIVLAVLVAAFSIPAFAANEHAALLKPMPGKARFAQMTDGLVKKVDKSAGKLTLSHGPLPNGMPAMTMVFRVKDAAWLDQVKAGDKVRFMADQINGAMTVVHLERN